MPLFEIPVCERVISVGRLYCSGKKTETMHVDSIGFFLHYDEEWQKTDLDFIRKHLQQRVDGGAYVEEANVHLALKKFYDQWEGAKVGGTEKNQKAIWINEKKFIYELPDCPRMSRNKKGDFICFSCSGGGEDDEERDDDFNRMCVLENYEAPENCVIETFRNCVRDYGEEELARAARNIEGFKFIELRTLTSF